MYRIIKTLAIIVPILLSIALYRAWVKRNQLPLFIPLGFFENATQVETPEEQARNPKKWIDPIAPIVRKDDEFELLARNAGAEERTMDVLVTGATFGGMSAAITAAENGVSVALVSENAWKSELLANAMLYVTDDETGSAPHSSIESRLRKWKSSSVYLETKNERVILPTDVVEFFDATSRAKPSLYIFESHFISAFGKDRYGKINRVLIQATDGSSASVIRFSYMIDGTQDGSAMALAGANTNEGWDTYEETGEPNTITKEAATAIAEGYTMSGRTTVGIGWRQDGARMNLAVIDRGYHGILAQPTSIDDCWKNDSATKTPFIMKGTVYKAQKAGCKTTTVLQPTFEDTVEVFYINHAADTVSATVTIGSGSTLNIIAKGDPRDAFIRIGAFPVSPASRLSITVRSSSPSDRFEGFIMRKTNVNAAPIIMNDYGESMPFMSERWKQTTYDVYVRTKTSTQPTLQIDDVFSRTEATGEDTFVARNVVLSSGKHTLYRANGSDYTILIPQRPHREEIPLSRQKNTPDEKMWQFTARVSGKIALLMPMNACEKSCEVSFNAQGTETPIFEEGVMNELNSVHSTTPVGTATIVAGTIYTINVTGAYDQSSPPIVALLDNSGEIYAIGTNNVSILPPAGGMYDVWIRSFRNDKAVATIGERNFAAQGIGTWNKVATEALPPDGVSSDGGGAVEILAIPNTSIDTYAVTLERKDVPVSIRDIPPGYYSLKSFGLENPKIINAVGTDNDVQTLEFIDDGDSYVSRKEYAIDGFLTTLALTTPWAQRVLLYESIDSTSFDVQNDQALLVPIVPAEQLGLYGELGDTADVARTSSGIFLFDPYPSGIGPVTIGDVDADDHRYYVRKMVNDAYAILRTGKMGLTKNLFAQCTDSTPTCDSRRLERSKDVYGTADALPPVPYYPDTRRLVGLETFTYDQAYATEPPCPGCAISPPPNAVLSFRSNVYPTTVVSPAEQRLSTLPTLLRSLRRDKKMSTSGTHLEYKEPLRDASITLGMLLSANEPNILSGNSTISATHIASRSIRSPSVQMAIGSVAGLATTFSLQKEFSDLLFISQSVDATARLQRYLVQRGITVMPLFEPADDPLLVQAMQQRVLDQKTSLQSTWINDRLSFVPSETNEDEISLLRLALFGNKPVPNIRDALTKLSDAPPNPTDLELLPFGLAKKIVIPKMFQLSLQEIMGIPLDEELLIKIQYLLQEGG